eukprot:12410601-Ditylum_brightwellii.AAC.1
MAKNPGPTYTILSSLVSNQLLQHQNPNVDIELNSATTTTTVYQQAYCMVVPCGDVNPHRRYNHDLTQVPPGTDLTVPRFKEVMLGSPVHSTRGQTPDL